MNVPAAVPRCGIASSEGLGDKGDVVHFDTPSLYELGKRYAAAFLRLAAGASSDPSVATAGSGEGQFYLRWETLGANGTALALHRCQGLRCCGLWNCLKRGLGL